MKVTIELDTKRPGICSKVLLDGVDVSSGLVAVEARGDLDSSEVSLTLHPPDERLTLSEESGRKLAEFLALPNP